MNDRTYVYCDTCIYLDFFWNRKGKYQDFGDCALSVFSRTRDGTLGLIISDWLLQELKRHVPKSKVTDFIKEMKVIRKISSTKEDKLKAKTLSPDHHEDALHAILASNAKADYLITRNTRDYAGCEDLVKIKLPENI